MKKNNFKLFMVITLLIVILAVPVLADGFTLVVPGKGDTPISAIMKKIENIMQIIQSNYYKDIKAEDLLNGALKGMFSVLDPHSMYFTKEEFKSFNSNISGDFGGLGIYIESKNDRVTVISPIDGTPAAKAGIKSGDQIIFVNDTDISNYTTEQASAIMRGDPGTKIKLGIRRDSSNDLIYFEMTREIIKINPVKYEIKEGNIGYIDISQFNGHVLENITKAINEFKAKNVKGVIIDVRDNPGGLLDEVVSVCKLLIPKGPIVTIDYKDKKDETFSSELAKAPFKIVMLINGGSASASEIMAGAIKESGTGMLVGEKTYGKGTVQTVLNLNDGTGLKVTIANYLTPKKFSLDGIGIMPDIEVKAAANDADQTLAPIKGNRSMSKNIIGLDVLGLQQRLNKLGYKLAKEDGIYGKNTAAAVLKFQQDNKLANDGVMDASDIKVLEQKLTSGTSGTDDIQLQTAINELKKMLQ